MRFGSPICAGLGSPSRQLEYLRLRVADDGTSILALVKPATGWGDAFFAFYCNAAWVCNLFLAESEEASVRLPAPRGSGTASVACIRLGARAVAPEYANVRISRSFEDVNSLRVTLDLTFVPVLVQPLIDDGGFTSSWTLTGLLFGRNCSPLPGSSCRASLDVQIVNDGGDCTVELYANGTLAASGAATLSGPTVVTLAAANGSGLSGSVTVDEGIGATQNCTLEIDWPAEVRIYRRLTPPPIMPYSLVGRIPFLGENTARWTEPADLSAGIPYQYTAKAMSWQGALSAVSSTLAVTIPLPPSPPSQLAYDSGNNAACVLHFQANGNEGDTYAGYKREDGATWNWNAPGASVTPAPDTAWQALHAYTAGQYVSAGAWNGLRYLCLGTGTSGATEPALPATIGATVADAGTSWRAVGYTVTLPAIAADCSASAVVRCTSGGVTEENLAEVRLEFDSGGDYVAPRPNTPKLAPNGLSVSAGSTVTAEAVYDPTGQSGVATQVQLFFRTPAGSYDFDTPADTETLAARAGGYQGASLSAALPGTGWYYLTVLAATAGGIQSPIASAEEYLVWGAADKGVVPDLSGISAHVSRG